jgi:hypothetical protein
MRLSRRLALIAIGSAGVAAVGAAVGLPRFLERCHRRGPLNLAARLGEMFEGRRAAAAVGMAYLKQPRNGSERNAAVLAGLIAQGLEESESELARLDDASFRSLLKKRVAADFEGEHVVTVSGCLLSRTEARLCAMSVLVRGVQG